MTKGEKLFNYIVVGVTAVVIIVSAILSRQDFFKTLPTLITLLVLLLSARANRYTFLLGAINCVLYSIIYIQEGIYFSVISCLVISAPMQLITFFKWKQHTYGKVTTVFKRLSARNLILMMLVQIPAWALAYFGLSAFITGSYPGLDSLSFVMGIVVSVLSAKRYIEAQYVNAVSCIISLIMWVLLTVKTPDNINYACIALYNVIMVVESAIVWTKQYKKQQAVLAKA